MVAGATGIDLFLLVVAADDGVMPQTREHLRIIELLGIPAGLVALTKIDMVDRELAELARADVEEFLGSTRYAGSPIVMVSGVTGEGLPELLAELDRVGHEVPARLSYPATRMPVDRVFSLRGIGTVVTGTLWSGTLTAEDVVAILPPRGGRGFSGLREVRVRSVQVHDHEVAAAVGGQRVALNLTGVARQDVDRGQWVVKDPAIEPTYLADGRLNLLDDAPGPVPRVFRARVDHGTAEMLVKVVLADQETLAPGRKLLRAVPLRGAGPPLPGRPVHRPLPDARHHHRRRASHRPGGAQARDRTSLARAAGPARAGSTGCDGGPSVGRSIPVFPGPRQTRSQSLPVAVCIGGDRGGSRRPAGRRPRGSGGRSGRPGASAAAPGTAVLGGGTIPPPGVAARLFHGPQFWTLAETTRAALTRRAQTDALNPYLTLGELRRELARGKEWPALDYALEHLLVAGEITRTEHGYRVAAAAGADEPDDETTTQLLAQFGVDIGGTGDHQPENLSAETPTVAVAAEAAGMSARDGQRLVDALVRRGRLVKVGEDLYYPPDRLEALMARLAAAMEAAGQITLAEARDLLGTSRRFAQAILEHMDSEGMTLRVGDARRLRRRRR